MFGNKSKFVLLLVCLQSMSLSAAENSQIDKIKNIVSRESGDHAIFLENTTLPNSDVCTLNDRAILVNTVGENRAMFAMAIAAMLSNASVELRTDGCVPVQPGSLSTAPRMIKIKLFKP